MKVVQGLKSYKENGRLPDWTHVESRLVLLVQPLSVAAECVLTTSVSLQHHLAPKGLVAQLVEHHTGVVKVHVGLIPT